MRMKCGKLAGITGMLLLSMVAVANADDSENELERTIDPQDLAPLAHLFAHIHGRFPGEVLRVEIEREQVDGHNIWLYEIKLLTPDGDVLKLRYDAHTLKLVRQHGHGRYGDLDGNEDHESRDHRGQQEESM